MLTLWGKPTRYCDGVSRRSFLGAGFLGMAGLSLADVLRLKARAATLEQPARKTSVIFIEMAGGPTQFESYDPKPNAPKEYRGALAAIDTKTPGAKFCEVFPAQAAISDRLTVIRSLHHPSNSHDPSSHLVQTGYYKSAAKNTPNQNPCFASVAAKLRGPNVASLPPYVAMPAIMRNGGAAYLGKSYNPFETYGDPNQRNFGVKNLTLARGLSEMRLDERKTLLASLDAQRKLADLEGAAEAQDEFTRDAFELVSGPAARVAFDIRRENDKTRDRYGRNSTGQSLLLARRLVESGVTCVTLRVGGWDDHADIFRRTRQKAAAFDRGVAALVTDLYDRGLDRDVLIVAIGEFGRTPRVNRNAGRDHWGALMSALLAGGGLKSGVFGTSNRKGEVPTEMPYRPENVLAMIYRHLGIESAATFDDLAGRPRFILEERRLIREII